MRPVSSITFAGFAVAASLWATRAQAGCSVDTDCLDDGLACGTDVCNKSGTCVPAGTDPGTCSSVSSCKCYGLYSVLCNPENHSCTITSADGGINSGGGAHGGGAFGGDDAGSTIGADDSGGAATDDIDAASSQGGTGSTSGTPGGGESSGTLAASTGSGGAGASNGASGPSSGGRPQVQRAGGASSGGSSPASKSSSGCSMGSGEGAPVGLFGIAMGAWALLGRRRRIAL
jgi:MYXO-CTERM domain-containing protein